MDESTQHKEQYGWVGLVLTVAGILALTFFVDIGDLSHWVEDAGVWAPLALILIKISTIVIAPLSGGPIYPVVGAIFGFWPGLFYVAVADIIAFSINFYLARKFGRRFVYKLLSGKEEGILNKTIDHISTGRGFFHANLTLFPMPEVLSYAAGLSKLPYHKFILSMGLINTAGAAVLVLIGTFVGATSSNLLKYLPILIGAMASVGGAILFIRSMKKRV